MKRILFLNYCYIGQGTYHRCYQLARYLADSGMQVDLICSTAKNWDYRIRIIPLSSRLRIITLPGVIRPGHPLGYLLRTLLGIFWVLTHRYHLVHAFAVALPSTAIPAWFAKHVCRLPLVIDWDDAWGDGYGEMFGKLPHKGIAWLERAIPRLAAPDAVTAVSEYFVQEFEKLKIPRQKIHRLPNGADTEIIRSVGKNVARKKLGIGGNEPVVMSMGHNYFSSLQILLQAFSLVRREVPSAKLYMVGQILEVGRWAKRTQAIWEKFTFLNDAIVHCGEVDYRREMSFYLAAADVLVLPMEISVLDQARAPIRIGDYLAAGRPIASNAIGYAREILSLAQCAKLNGNPTDPQELGWNIVQLLQDQENSAQMGRAGRRLAEGAMNWRSLGQQLLLLYNQLEKSRISLNSVSEVSMSERNR
jgi:glycosyltransferase involved in cell wall biosynthesis